MNSSPNSLDDLKPPRRSAGSLRVVATSVLISLTLFAGVVHGCLDGRWTANKDLHAVGDRLDNLPEQVGDWRLSESLELEPNAAKLLRCYGSSVRVYENQETGNKINVALLFGPRGPIAVHTPEICYSSLGTKQIGNRQTERITEAGINDGLWSVQFAVDPNPNPTLEVWYGWSDGGAWEAREQPRFWLTHNLYKIQVAGPKGDESNQPVKNFMKSFLPLTHSLMGDS